MTQSRTVLTLSQLVNPPSSSTWPQRAGIWLGIGLNPASISTGGGLAILIPFRHLVWVLPAGALLLALISTTQGSLGQQRRERLAGLAAHTLGPAGARLLSLLMAIGLIGWSGFHGGVSGASMAELWGLPQWAGALLIIGPLYLLSIYGINRWAALSWVTTGAALALTLFALTAVDLRATAAAHPADQLTLADLLRTLSTIIGYATLFSLRTPDFTWDFASRGDVIKVNLFYLIPLLFSLWVGALLYRATGHWNIADVLAQTHSAALGHLFLIVAVISPLVSGWYSGAFAISHLTGLRPNQSTLLICTLGLLLAATRFDQQLLPFLTYLSAGLGPALVLMILLPRLKQRPTTSTAFVAWLVGAVVAIGLRVQGQPLDLLAGMGITVGVLSGLWWRRGGSKV